MELYDEQVAEVFEKVVHVCNYSLYKDKEALEYLYNRGLTDETIKTFRLGAFPKDDLEFLVRYVGGYELAACQVLSRKDGGYASRFFDNNLIIPIFDAHGNPIAIMGRALDQSKIDSGACPKYFNTIYPKSQMLFGLHLAKDEIRKKNEAFLVEGNMDVIAAHQQGKTNVVATSGAFLSPDQITMLARYTDRMAICLDNDEAGRKAAERIIKGKTRWKDLTFYERRVPEEYKDLDEYIQARRKDATK